MLLALVDANYRFIYVDIGSYGRNSDSGIFSRSSLGKAILTGDLKFPKDSHLPNDVTIGPMPYVFVEDEAFPLQRHMLRPYPGRDTTQDQQAFNYRLSRARRIVENAFGILSQRWCIFHTKIALQPDKVNAVIKACCVLHNMLQRNQENDEIEEECEGLQVL